MKNKKADIPVSILVLGVFVICSLALLSFYSSSFKLRDSFVGLNLMEEMNTNIAEYSFYKSQGFQDGQIKSFLENPHFYFQEKSFVINETQTNLQFAWSLKKDDWIKKKLSFSVEYFR